jgi:hypothetical protein
MLSGWKWVSFNSTSSVLERCELKIFFVCVFRTFAPRDADFTKLFCMLFRREYKVNMYNRIQWAKLTCVVFAQLLNGQFCSADAKLRAPSLRDADYLKLF